MRALIGSLAFLLILGVGEYTKAEFIFTVNPSKHQTTNGGVNETGKFTARIESTAAAAASNIERMIVTSATVTPLAGADPDITFALSADLQNHIASGGTSPFFLLGPSTNIDLIDWTVGPGADPIDISRFEFTLNFSPGQFLLPNPGGAANSPGGSFSFTGFVAVPEPSFASLAILSASLLPFRRRRSR